MADLVSRAKAIVITKKTRAEVPLCLVFAAQSVETMAAQYTLPEGVLAFYVTPADRTGITDPSSAAGAASSSSTRSLARTDTITVMRAEIQAVWPRDDDDVYLPVQGALGEVVAPEWAAGLVVSRVRAAGIEEDDEKDMRKRGASRRQGRKLMAASSTAQPPGVVKTLTAAVLPPDAPLPRPPPTEKELCWLNAADKQQSDADNKRKMPVKKRRGKKLTVAESEAGAEAEAARRYGHRRACVAAGGRGTRDEGVIWKGDPGDFYMKVIAKKFRGVWHYGVITGVVTEWVLEDYGGATQWRAVFEDGDIVGLLRSEVVEAMAAAQEHPPVDADGEARLVTVHEGDDLSRSGKVTVQSGWVMEGCLHHMETFSILNAGPLLEEARVKAIMTEKELRVPRRCLLGHMYKRMQGAAWFVTRWGLQNVVTEEDGPERKAQRGAKARRPGQRGAKARRPGQRGAKARRPGQRGAKARRPGQRRAKARRPGQRGAKARRPGQRGAKARRPGQRRAKARRPGQRGAKARRPGQRRAKARRPGQRGAKARRPGQRGAKTAHTAESA
eukprot:jgi/Tetstr1/454983/TSEL_041843.t1